MQELSTTLSEGLIADLAVRGVWQRQCTSMFEFRILDSDSPSYSKNLPYHLLQLQKLRKRGNTLLLVNPIIVVSLLFNSQLMV